MVGLKNKKKRAHQGEEPLEREVNKPVSITGERLIRIDEKSFNFQEKTELVKLNSRLSAEGGICWGSER